MTQGHDMENRDYETDLLVIGSGGGGLTAALTAKLEGLESMVLEKTEYYGGSTAISGGGVWIPNNHLMAEVGIEDSLENVRTYMANSVGDRTPAANQEAFITQAPVMLKYLSKLPHMKFNIMPGYADYYPGRPGGMNGGRGVDTPVFSGKGLGDILDQLRPSPIRPPFDFVLTINEIRKLALAKAHPPFIVDVLKIFVRNIYNKIFGRKHAAVGGGLIARLRMSLYEKNVPVWLNTPVTNLIIENDSVIGVEAEKKGKKIRIRAKKGVVLAAGGFPHNKAMREKYQKHPIGTEWTAAAPGNTGEIIEMGIKAGAAIDLMEDSWWGPTHNPPGEAPIFMVLERAYPGCVIVNSAGRRFVNEAVSYVDFGHAMYDANSENGVSAIPSYLILDNTFRNNYILGMILPGILPKKHLKSGYVTKADTIGELADKTGIDPSGLADTIKKNNDYARTGKDQDFGKGDSVYDRFYCKPANRPNPCLAPIEKPPFYSVKLYPGDLGTKGGLVTDEHARVLKEDGTVIDGLYAVGNCSASVMGNTYPGPGSTIGPAMTFGYIAALHAAGQKVGKS
jgi:3-oxosteroid 1-dehydrogenase